jgi:glycosyltransferase involved in cell wall biosynthesis
MTTALSAAHARELSSVASRLTVVIPAFNEEAGIAPTLSDLTARLPEAEIVVVDDGSTDGTVEEAARFPQVILAQHPFNRGYGAALKTGMTVASREFIAWFDADNEHRVQDLVVMARRIATEPIAAIIAQRGTPGPSPLRTWGKVVIRSLARALSSEAGKDINCGLRIFRRDVINRYLPLLPNTFSASITSTIIMLERGYPVAFQQVELNKRLGNSKVKVSDGFVALMIVLRIIMLFAPMRIFLRAGVILFAIGAAYSLFYAVVLGRGVPTAGLGMMLGAALMVFFGLVADQISQIRLTAYDQPLFTLKSRPEPGQRQSDAG